MRNLTISTNVRPGRTAVLVDVNDGRWQDTCVRILEYFARNWGGCGNIIIPTDGKAIAPCFWQILDRFDPDYLHVYKRTGRDIEIEEPELFQSAVDQHVAAWEKQIGEAPHASAIESIRDSLQNSIETTFDVTGELQLELKRRLAPFFFEQSIVEAGWLSADTAPHHLDTDIVDILPHIEHSEDVLATDDHSRTLGALWCGSLFGCQNSALRDQLGTLGIKPLEFEKGPDGLKRLIRLGLAGREDPRSVAYWADAPLETVWKWLEAFPSRFSMIGLGGYRSFSHQDWREPVIAVAGNTIRDFCFYYALSRMRDRVVWVLPSITECALAGNQRERKVDHEFHFATALGSLSRGGSQREGGLRLTSVTLNSEQLDLVKKQIEVAGFDLPLEQCEYAEASSTLPPYPIRYIEANNAFRSRSVTVPDDGVIPLFETPIPKNFKRVEPSKHRWITELSIAGYHLPRHPSLGWWMMSSRAVTTKDVRVSSVGPSYFCPSNLILGGNDIDTSVIRPSIAIPEPLQLFEIIARSASLQCRVSDKGFYANESCKKFGGLAQIAEFLRSPTGRAVRTAFLDKRKPEQGDYSKGFLLAGRRYLDFPAFQAAIGSEAETTTTVEELSQRGVLYRGFVLQCQYCRRTDWFPVGAITDSFTCSRCHREQVYTRAHWMYSEQPNWYHQLDEIVYQGLAHDMDVPLLTLDRLRSDSKDNLIAASELCYYKEGEDKPMIECDINCVLDGVLTLGEAKTTDRLGKTEKQELAVLAGYRSMARLLGAPNLVFATSAERWREKTLANILRVFSDEPVSIRLLSRRELYRLA